MTLREIHRIVGDIATVSNFVRNTWQAPTPVRLAARTLRETVDADALVLVLDWLATGHPTPPTSVGAAGWNLGGHVLDTIRQHAALIQQHRAA